ncbi:hypothetical protein SDC9_109325 [bioreactor metagenome]|uniref:Uncharacterized protein n=1 Tax=bioreactor metagenome TaxID=1076179 RepID=A0A645BGW3_9ZZZZ
MHVARALGQRGQHRLKWQPAVDQRIGDFVEHHQKMLARHDRRTCALPAIARQLRGMLQIAALPTEAIAQSFNRKADALEHAVFTKARGRHLHELEDLDALAASMRAQRKPECGRALALAVARVHDQQATPLAVWLLVAFVDRWCFDFHVVPSSHWMPCRRHGQIDVRPAPQNANANAATRPRRRPHAARGCDARTPVRARRAWRGRRRRHDAAHGRRP